MKFSVNEANDIKWLSIFEALSTDKFEWFYEDLYVPFTVTDDLKRIAREFVSVYHYGNLEFHQVPDVFDRRQWHGVTILSIWDKLYQLLNESGYADDLIRWAKLTHPALLKDNYPLRSETDWYGLLLDWARFPDLKFSSLPLPDRTATNLKLLLLREHILALQLRANANDSRRLARGDWDTFAFEALHVDNYFSLQTQFLLRIKKWKAIFDLLADEDLVIIEDWGVQQFGKTGLNYKILLTELKRSFFSEHEGLIIHIENYRK